MVRVVQCKGWCVINYKVRICLLTICLDYNALLKLFPPGSPQIDAIKRSLQSLEPRIEEAQKKETGEMLDKLKGEEPRKEVDFVSKSGSL